MKKLLAVFLCFLILGQTAIFATATSEYESVTGNAKSYFTKKEWANAVQRDGLFDGNKETGVGSGTANVDAYVFGDLGEGGQQVDKVVITAYDKHLRLKGVKYYLSNTLPIGNATNQDKSDWVLLGEIATCPQAVDADGATMSFELSLAQSGVYRYVIADYTAGTTQGGNIQEIEVYKKKFKGIVQEVSVTGDAQSYFTKREWANAVQRDGLFDGDQATGVGSGTAGVDAYVFGDLGEGGKQIDKVVITAYDKHLRLKGVKYYLTNTQPIGNANLDKSDWVLLGEIATCPQTVDADGATKTFNLSKAQAGIYRYIVADYTAGTTQGGIIHEIEAYAIKEVLDDVISNESGMVTDTSVSYTSDVLSINKTGAVVGLFSQYNAKDDQINTAYADGTLPEKGKSGTVLLNAEVTGGKNGTWDTAILLGKSVYSYISDLETAKKASAYTYETTSAITSYKVTGLTAEAIGTAGAGVLGMIVLKPGASFDAYTAADVVCHQVAVAPETCTGPWEFTLRCTVPNGATAGDYTVGFFSDTGVLSDETYTLTVYDTEAIALSFKDVTAETFVSLAKANKGFFGEALVADIEAVGENVGKSFMMAKEGFTAGVFNEKLTSWEDINTITAAIQSALVIEAAKNNADVARAISAYGASMPAIFNSADYNSAGFVDILPSVMTASKPQTGQDVAMAFNRSIALSLIAGGELADKEKALTNYREALGILDETIETEYSMRKIAGELSNSVDVVKSDYAAGLNQIVADIIAVFDEESEDDDNTDLGYTGSGGGSFGGGISKIPAIPNPPTYVPEQDVPVVENAPQEETTLPFNDIAKHDWAHEAIFMLKERNILDGVGAEEFAPDNLLTREQAVKLLVLTLNLATNETENGYRDCVFSDWYYPYITTAKVTGLVSGISRDTFGIGKNVTRQDLAVMLYRALEKEGINTTAKDVQFIDDNSISEYAKQAVAALSELGMITGYPDGSFGPQEPATRAQAAVIFAHFLELKDAQDAMTEEVTAE